MLELDTYCIAFSNWLKTAKSGDKFCYYTGKFVAGKTVAKLAFTAYLEGKVTLYQKRHEEKFAYWAEYV